MNTETLLTEMKQTADKLQQTVNAFPQQTFNEVPFPGSWTPAQVCEHVLKSCGVSAILNGKTRVTEREPDVNVAPLREQFLNFNIKMQSPDFILPSDKPHTKEEMMEALERVWEEMMDDAAMLDLSITCLDFELPGIGAMTRYEWLNFLTVHTKRHIHQMEKMQGVAA